MNAIEQQFEVLDQTLALRHTLIDSLTDADLSFAVTGNPSLGELCHEMWQVEQSYIDSFKTFTQDWTAMPTKPALATSVDALKAAYTASETALKQALAALTETDIQGKMVERGFQVPVSVQFHIYREALLIFYGKTDVYLRALGKTRPEQWRQWISY